MIPWLPAPLSRWFDNAFHAGLHASAEALFPEAPGMPGFEEVEMERRMVLYIRALPPEQSPMVALLYVLVEYLAWVVAPWKGRLSRRTIPDRLALVQGWRDSRIWPLQVVGDALRASLCMVYFSHPAVMRAYGEPVDFAGLVEDA